MTKPVDVRALERVLASAGVSGTAVEGVAPKADDPGGSPPPATTGG